MRKKRNIFYTAVLVVLGLVFGGSFLWRTIRVLGVTNYDSSSAKYVVGVSNSATNTEFITAQKPPSISAKSFVIGDLDTGEIILSNDAKLARPIASISKLMTALVAKERMSATSTILVSKEAKVGQCAFVLKVGSKIALKDMFYPLLLASNNEAAEAIAITYGRDDFIKLMNSKASELGLSSMYFNDPSGLSSENLSSATDLFLFAKYLYQNQSDIIDMTKTKKYQIPRHLWTNISKFINDADYIGGKNGFTDDAGKTVIAMFKEKIGDKEHNLAFILLDGLDNKKDVDYLISFLKEHAVS